VRQAARLHDWENDFAPCLSPVMWMRGRCWYLCTSLLANTHTRPTSVEAFFTPSCPPCLPCCTPFTHSCPSLPPFPSSPFPTGAPLVRINLSEQTDMMDLLGADLPVAGGAPGEFAW
jgi:hypothetical protein